MKTVGVYEAKSKFSSLLEEVERGGVVTITRHGKAVAQLAPVVPAKRRPMAELVEEFRSIRAPEKPIGVRMRELIEEGRLY